MAPFLTDVFVVAFGMCIGSFAGVCIHRIPLGRSIVRPGSRCPRCETPLRFYDNVPLLSYVWLKGICRYCRGSISPRYPLLELLTGFLALGAYFRFGISWEGGVYFALIAVLLIVTFIDIDHGIIPDIILLPGIPVAVLCGWSLPAMTLVQCLLGLAAGAGILWVVALAYRLIARREGMGSGDVLLMAMIGAVIGWQGVLFTIFTASALGTVAGFAIMLKQGKDLKMAIPFGPFLSMGAMAYIFFGPRVMRWYLGYLV